MSTDNGGSADAAPSAPPQPAASPSKSKSPKKSPKKSPHKKKKKSSSHSKESSSAADESAPPAPPPSAPQLVVGGDDDNQSSPPSPTQPAEKSGGEAAAAPATAAATPGGSPFFELRVALVSASKGAGRSTVLNALLRANAAAAAGRDDKSNNAKHNDENDATVVHCYRARVAAVVGGDSSSSSSSKDVEQNPRNRAKLVSEETVELLLPKSKGGDNGATTKQMIVRERTYDVEIAREVLPDMRRDTLLSFTVVPAFNDDEDEGSLCAQYLKEKRDAFDAAIAVVDGSSSSKKGLSDRETELLQLLRDLWHHRGDNKEEDEAHHHQIPLFVLVNKIGNAAAQDDDKKQAKAVKKALRAIETIFGVGDRAAALQSVLVENAGRDGGGGGNGSAAAAAPQQPFPVCVAASALHAYIGRVGAEAVMAERLGRTLALGGNGDNGDNREKEQLLALVVQEYLGSKTWKKLSPEQQCLQAHAILTDPDQYREGVSRDCHSSDHQFSAVLDRYHFDQFLAALERYLGGAHRQERLLRKQIQRTLDRKLGNAFSSEWISYAVTAAYRDQRRLLRNDASSGSNNPETSGEDDDGGTAALQEAFWRTFRTYQDGILAKFATTFPNKVSMVSNPLQELIYYHRLVVFAKWGDAEEEKVLHEMKLHVRRYLHFLIRRQHETNGNRTWSFHAGISPVDWKVIWRSVLLLSYDRDFCQLFGREKCLCEDLVLEAHRWAASGQFDGHDQHCTHCPARLEHTKRKPHVPRCGACKIIFLREEQPVSECLYCGNGHVVPVDVDANGESASNGSNGSNSSPLLLQCPNCQCRYEALPNPGEWLKVSYNGDSDGDGNICEMMKPAHPDNYRKVVHLDVPESLSDANHYGHAVYKFLEFAASLQNKKSSVQAEDGSDEKQVAKKEESDQQESSK